MPRIRRNKVEYLLSIFRQLRPVRYSVNIGYADKIKKHLVSIVAYDSPLAVQKKPRAVRFEAKDPAEVPTYQETHAAFREYQKKG